MNLVNWDPVRELEDVSARLNRIFMRPSQRPETGNEKLAVADWAPSVDISETDNAYLIKGEIPGVKKEDIQVNIRDGMLTMRGERKMEKEEKGRKYHRIERSYGSFVRSFSLPDDADEYSVKAEFSDGMLNITLAKSAKAGGRSIDVAVA